MPKFVTLIVLSLAMASTVNDASAQFIAQPAIKFRRFSAPTINKGIEALGYTPKSITVSVKNVEAADSSLLPGYIFPEAMLNIPDSNQSGVGFLEKILPSYTAQWSSIQLSSDAIALALGNSIERHNDELVVKETGLTVFVYYRPGFTRSSLGGVSVSPDVFSALTTGELAETTYEVRGYDGHKFDVVLSSK